MSLEKVPKAAWAGAGVLVLLIVAAVVVLVAGGSSSSGEDLKLTGDAYSGFDAANSRHTGGPIDSGSVNQLEVAWTLPLTARSSYGAYSSSPAISHGVVYSQDLESNVQAISLGSGEVLWTKNYNQADEGPNGVTVADGRVYGATPTEAFALDQETGKQLWSTPLAHGAHEGIDMAPGYHDGLVYVATVPVTATSAYEGGVAGVLWALDAKTGAKAWHFDTVPKNLWGDPTDNSGGGLWYPPSFDAKGEMYIGVGNPSPFPGTDQHPWGSSRPGPNLYTDSIVKLDAKTGKLRWYYQLTPHDVYDWDLQDPPLLVKAGGRELAVGAGKGGIVVAVDAANGKLAWKTPVGRHNGHDEDDLLAMHGEASKLKLGEVFPGTLGGVIAPMSTDGSTVFVPIVNHSLTTESGSKISEESPITGELVAVDAASGKVLWQHELPSAAFGATTAVNDLVFATTYEGSLYAFDAKTGSEVWVASLPAGANTGVSVAGDTVLAPAGAAVAEGQTPELVAYRLGG